MRVSPDYKARNVHAAKSTYQCFQTGLSWLHNARCSNRLCDSPQLFDLFVPEMPHPYHTNDPTSFTYFLISKLCTFHPELSSNSNEILVHLDTVTVCVVLQQVSQEGSGKRRKKVIAINLSSMNLEGKLSVPFTYEEAFSLRCFFHCKAYKLLHWPHGPGRGRHRASGGGGGNSPPGRGPCSAPCPCCFSLEGA